MRSDMANHVGRRVERRVHEDCIDSRCFSESFQARHGQFRKSQMREHHLREGSPGTPASDRRGYAQSSLVNGALAVCRDFVLLQESPVGKIINDFGRRFDYTTSTSSVPTPEGDASSDWCTRCLPEDQRVRCDLLPGSVQASSRLPLGDLALERSWQNRRERNFLPGRT